MDDIEKRQQLADIARSALARPRVRIPFWTRIRLWFRSPQLSVDMGQPGGDKTAWVLFKELDGKVYVVRNGYDDTLMEEFRRMGVESTQEGSLNAKR